ncbi:hypothetical protein JKP88DRAFT_315898 [Tribonema minus]|uniref:Telomere length regulation protein conserved domain-containing protein n=1 Tax=Tribonema minus TaxID=303371 RepID=A0A835Z5Z2_9STRA|nr:hypothetical protein JKP88DRAFT_315898 [Tribonema minus]
MDGALEVALQDLRHKAELLLDTAALQLPVNQQQSNALPALQASLDGLANALQASTAATRSAFFAEHYLTLAALLSTRIWPAWPPTCPRPPAMARLLSSPPAPPTLALAALCEALQRSGSRQHALDMAALIGPFLSDAAAAAAAASEDVAGVNAAAKAGATGGAAALPLLSVFAGAGAWTAAAAGGGEGAQPPLTAERLAAAVAGVPRAGANQLGSDVPTGKWATATLLSVWPARRKICAALSGLRIERGPPPPPATYSMTRQLPRQLPERMPQRKHTHILDAAAVVRRQKSPSHAVRLHRQCCGRCLPPEVSVVCRTQALPLSAAARAASPSPRSAAAAAVVPRCGCGGSGGGHGSGGGWPPDAVLCGRRSLEEHGGEAGGGRRGGGAGARVVRQRCCDGGAYMYFKYEVRDSAVTVRVFTDLMRGVPAASAARVAEALVAELARRLTQAGQDGAQRILSLAALILGSPLSIHAQHQAGSSQAMGPVGPVLQRMLTGALLLRRPLPPSAAPVLAHVLASVEVSVANGGRRPSSLLMAALRAAAGEWCDAAFVHRAAAAQQELITRFLLEGLARVTAEQMATGDLTLLLVRGVGVRLEVTATAQRLQGMRVGEALSQIVGEPVHFDELEESRRGQAEGPPAGDDSGSAQHVGAVPEAAGAAEGADTNGAAHGDSGGDGLLRPYDITEDSATAVKGKPLAPLYLHQAIEVLRRRDDDSDYDSHAAALRSVERLTRLRPADLFERTPELLRELLYLDDRFAMEDFQELQTGAMVAACACAPLPAVQFLCEQLFDSCTTTGAKLQILQLFDSCTTTGAKRQILQVLSLSAQELAGRARPGAPGGPPQVQLESSTSRRKAGDSVVSSRLQARREANGGTAVTSAESHVRMCCLVPLPYADCLQDAAVGTELQIGGPKTSAFLTYAQLFAYCASSAVPNKFCAVAAAFAYPLMQGFAATQTRKELWGHSDSALLLARMLLALAHFVDCGAPPPVPGDALAFAWTFKHSAHAEIRSAVLAVLVCCLGSPGAGGELGDAGGGEVVKWLRGMAGGGGLGEGDREAAVALLGVAERTSLGVL